MSTTVKVLDMTCAHCANAIQQALKEVPEIGRFEVDLVNEEVRLSGTASLAAAVQAIESAGYTVAQ